MTLGIAAALAFAVLVAGCTTMQRVELGPGALRAAIRDGAVAEPGQRVVVATADGDEYALVYRGVDARLDVVQGEGASAQAVTLPIASIVALRTQTTDRGRTMLLTLGVLAAAWLAVSVAAADGFTDALVDALP